MQKALPSKDDLQVRSKLLRRLNGVTAFLYPLDLSLVTMRLILSSL